MTDHTEAELTTRRKMLLASSSYLLAEVDTAFLRQEDLRPIRFQLELLKAEMLLDQQGVQSTIVVFGSAQIFPREDSQKRLTTAELELEKQPDDPILQRKVARQALLDKSHYYDEAREFARIVSSTCQTDKKCDYVVCTGGGPGIMEAANRGADDVNAKSVGLNITLPEEQAPNPYITPELCFQFRYFALRKMHFLLRAKALVVFPGGFGTLDEMFEVLTLRQTRRMQAIPVILYGRDYWNKILNLQALADEGVITDDHLKLITFAETPDDAWNIIANFHDHDSQPWGLA